MSSSKTFQPLRTHERVAKAIGADVELANFIEGVDHPQKTGRTASRLLLREIEGISQSGLWQTQDWGRKFLPANGGCAYVDLDHLELPLPEVVSAYDFVAVWHAMLRIARRAMHGVNENAEGARVRVLANNSDGLGNSYGSHLNVLLTRRAFDNIFHRKVHQMLWLAAYQVSSIVFTGQGKVGAENGAPSMSYQISQRADFFETLTGIQTTERRPLVNCRDEPLCGKRYRGDPESREAQHLARPHVIFYDSNLCHVACLLKIGVLQIALAMLEAEQINPELILDDPVAAVVEFSHDPTLRRKARLAGGAQLTRWHGWPVYRTVWMPDPLGMTQSEAGDRLGAAASLEEAIDALGACHEPDDRLAWTDDRPLRALPAPEKTPQNSNDPPDSQPLLQGDPTDAIS